MKGNLTDLANRRSPPAETVRCTGIEDGEENHDASDGHGRIQRRTECEVILGPPGMQALTDEKVKDQPDHGPAAIVGPRRGREVLQPAQEQGDVDTALQGVVVVVVVAGAALEEVDGDGQNGADEEEVPEGVVADAAGEEVAPGADGTPD